MVGDWSGAVSWVWALWFSCLTLVLGAGGYGTWFGFVVILWFAGFCSDLVVGLVFCLSFGLCGLA